VFFGVRNLNESFFFARAPEYLQTYFKRKPQPALPVSSPVSLVVLDALGGALGTADAELTSATFVATLLSLAVLSTGFGSSVAV
jgi:hypothetical protein